MGNPTYASWWHMVARCTKANHSKFARYGARGIKVCDRWLKFENFVADMGERPAGMTIDRWPDGEGNYEPGNCRWATSLQQNQNRSFRRFELEHAGEKLSIRAWGRRLGIGESTIRSRLKSGLPIDVALTASWPSQRAALVRLLDVCERMDAEGQAERPSDDEYQCAIRAARAAIAKATGGAA